MEKFCFVKIDEKLAEKIAYWVYPEPYSIYSFDGDGQTIDEFIHNGYHAAVDGNGEPIGFFCFGKEARIPTVEEGAYAENALDVGLGLKPEICGKGLGKEFFLAGLSLAKKNDLPFRLTVAAFNERAIRVYRAAGFEILRTVTHRRTKMSFHIMIEHGRMNG